MPNKTKLSLENLEVKSFKTIKQGKEVKGGSFATACFDQNISICCRLK